jgi:DNA-directed RNA polymerase subunit RPC12/RpoP
MIFEIFNSRSAIIATKHNKEQVIKPLLENQLDVQCFVPADFDTDLLGTFTGEIERAEDPLSTVRKKCLMAMDKYEIDLGIASEGSFGPHPEYFFINSNIEIVIFIDQKNNLEIVSSEISTDTNFNGKEISTEKELRDFADKALFPSHGLILRDKIDSKKVIVKDIFDWSTLSLRFHEILEEFGSVYVETDMRAMNNPSRMKVIEKAVTKLISKINSRCPNCEFPGFDIIDSIKGLPCSLCDSPTESVLSHIYQCLNCSQISEKKFPKGKTSEDPMYCPYCNP